MEAVDPARRASRRERRGQSPIKQELTRRGLLPVKEAAELMGMSVGRLRRLIKAGRVEAVQVPWRDTVVPAVPARRVAKGL